MMFRYKVGEIPRKSKTFRERHGCFAATLDHARIGEEPRGDDVIWIWTGCGRASAFGKKVRRKRDFAPLESARKEGGNRWRNRQRC